ncbi:MAG: DUF3299 domain-containing protein [Cyclobacteriaceae bacterium]|jgi:hypothetical protein|nr:DUF3299 domain-containing protein [Cyclobacteriaceae bacterium]
MMGRLLTVIFLAFFSWGWTTQDSVGEEGWDTLARVPFHSKFFKEHNEYFLVPTFHSGIRAREGKEITLKGHFMPFDLPDKSIILSKYPYAACFFCGGAGPESVAEVVFASKPPRFKADQIITVKGKLKLNDNDVSHLNFILTEAELIK